MSIVVCDTREQKDEHIISWFNEHNIHWIRSKLYVGDYTYLDNMTTCIDRKHNMQEVYSNVIQQHNRFRSELMRAQESGIRLVVLVEDEKIKNIDEVKFWNNPRIWQYRIMKKQGKEVKWKEPASSETISKIMNRMSYAYGVEWQFCKPGETAETIIKILGGNDGGAD